MNLLIGFDEMQTTLLNAYKAKSNVTNGEIEAYRDSLVSTLVAKDQRVSWIYSGYGEYDDVNNKFTFKESYVKNENLREFNGTIKNAKPYEYLDSYGKSKTGYNYGKITATDVTYNNFKTTFEKVMGVALVGENWAVTNIERTLGEKDVDNFRDLIFAYSTDSGSLSETYGYIYSPLTSSTTYVKEFANKAKDLVALGEGAIGAVTTDYGVHVMLCSKVIVGTGKTVMDKATFENKLTNENEIPYQFKEYKLNVVVAGEVNNKATSFINANKSKVEYYEDRYSDLITKE
ncbi:MAG: hypothetical protein J6R88_04055 [Clostridia bacterium]|nr:hypothetical protein [Clostridia bacterium]